MDGEKLSIVHQYVDGYSSLSGLTSTVKSLTVKVADIESCATEISKDGFSDVTTVPFVRGAKSPRRRVLAPLTDVTTVRMARVRRCFIDGWICGGMYVSVSNTVNVTGLHKYKVCFGDLQMFIKNFVKLLIFGRSGVILGDWWRISG